MDKKNRSDKPGRKTNRIKSGKPVKKSLARETRQQSPDEKPAPTLPDPQRADRPRTLLKPSTLLSPVPVALVSCCGLPGGACARPNLITIAWTGTICSEPPMLSISVRPSRHSHQQILETGEFVVNLVDRALLPATDYCGVRSGRDEDKFAACSLTAVAAPGLQHAPAVAESPLHLACKVRQSVRLGSHDCFLAEILSVSVAQDLLDKKNRLCLDKADLVAYLHGEYFLLGERVGFFGYSVAAPAVLARRLRKGMPQQRD